MTVVDGEAAYMQRDYAKAREIWAPLVERQNDAEAAAWLGALYANGLGVGKDLAEAFRLYLLAAEHGNILAANNVAVMYANGEGVEKNPEKASEWLRMAA